MIIEQRARRGGKTTMLLHWLNEHPSSILVCASEHIADFTRRQGHLMFSDWDEAWMRRHIVGPDPERLRGLQGELVIDNIDIYLEYLFGRPIHAVTASTDGLL